MVEIRKNPAITLHAAARNLGLLMRALFGVGKPRCLQGAAAVFVLSELFPGRFDRCPGLVWALCGRRRSSGHRAGSRRRFPHRSPRPLEAGAETAFFNE